MKASHAAIWLVVVRGKDLNRRKQQRHRKYGEALYAMPRFAAARISSSTISSTIKGFRDERKQAMLLSGCL
jgi:hypothetical protein